jgi:hypothetical protein
MPVHGEAQSGGSDGEMKRNGPGRFGISPVGTHRSAVRRVDWEDTMLGLLLVALLIAVLVIVLGVAVTPILFILLVAAALMVGVALVRRAA